MTREALLDAMVADAIRKNALREAEDILNEKSRVKKNDVARFTAETHIEAAARILNEISDDFFSKIKAERLSLLGEKGENTVVLRIFAEFLSSGSYASNMRALIQLARSFGSFPVIIVQSPEKLEPATRQQMTQLMRAPGEPHIVLFQVVPSLLGGLRIFRDGRMQDESVRGKITQLFQSI